ncbi:hypothetical protein E4V42_21235 [Clostridium estertheticum]|uniref:GPP34 family phosphoprotein n=1 Tax=Clostridium estertheticum TaxID=238834 RepID=A0A5N7J8A7_9CLOT|nr:hypothetical protein [Clostridium estertheticum]MPQ33927.1 hypothetical protein [Clostridium estertheticum]MPQ64942.1 hypothetical protein [Clostridium estertheticum]
MKRQLTVAQEFGILVYRNKIGLLYHPKLLTVGAVIYDLISSGKVELDNKNRINVINNFSEIESEQIVLKTLSKKKNRKLFLWIVWYYVTFNSKSVYQANICKLKSSNSISTAENIVQKIRAELLEDGNIYEGTVFLSFLLKKVNLLKKYFSKYESEDLNKTINRLKNEECYKVYSIISKSITILDIAVMSH